MFLLQWASIDDAYRRDAQLKPEDVAVLDEWQRKQPHLPAPLHSIETALFLHSSRYSIAAAKQRIDTYYTQRTLCPEFFANRDPFGKEVQLALNTWIMLVLPELTPDGYLVHYLRLRDRNPTAFDYNASVKTGDMIINLVCRQRGYVSGHIFVIDLDGFTIGHLLKCNVLSMKKALNYAQNASAVKVRAIHYVNSVPFMDRVLALLRPFLGAEWRDALHAHYGDNSSIFTFVPRHMLPLECGGSTFCAIEYYQNVMRRNVENHSEFFKREEQQLSDESKRLLSGHLFGIEGTFKKLNVD